MSITHFQFASRLRGSFAGVLEQQCREVSSKHQRLGRWGVRESQDHWWSLVTSPGSLHVAIGCLVSVIVHSFRYKNLARTRLKKVLPWEGVCPPSYLHCASPWRFLWVWIQMSGPRLLMLVISSNEPSKKYWGARFWPSSSSFSANSQWNLWAMGKPSHLAMHSHHPCLMQDIRHFIQRLKQKNPNPASWQPLPFITVG